MTPQTTKRAQGNPAGGGARLTVAVLLLVLLVTVGIRLVGLGDLRFEEDECFYAAMADQSLEFVVTHAYYSTTYHGWFFPYKAWLMVTSGDDVARKSLSLLCGVLSVLGLFLVARRLEGRRVGLLAALLLALNGYHFYFSRIASPYAFLSLLGVVIVGSFLALLDRGSRRAAALHAVALGAAFYCHPAAALLLVAEATAVGLLAVGGLRARLRLAALSLGAALVMGAGALHMMVHQWHAIQQIGYEPFLQEIGPEVLHERVHNLLAYGSRLGAAVPLEYLLLLVLLCVAGFSIWRVARHGDQRHWPRATLALVWVLPFAACVTAGLLIAPMMLYEARFLPSWRRPACC